MTRIETRRQSRRRRPMALRWGALVLVVIGVLAGCGDDGSDGTGESGDDMTTTSNDSPVCGLIDRALVRNVVGDAEIGTRGPGISPKDSRALEPAYCTVQNAELSRTVLQVSIGEIEDPEQRRQKLENQAAGEPGCTRYTDDPGFGYGCTYNRGVWVDGAGVYVLRGDRAITAIVHHWPGVTPQQRLALAEDIARDMDRNVTEYDESHA